MSTDNGLSAGQTMGHRPIFVDPASNCLCTTNPANGQVVWIVDPETGQPLTARQVYSDPASGCLCSVDPATGKVAWIIDPATGRPMVGPQAQTAEPAPQQVEQAVQQPVDEPWVPAVDEPVQQAVEEPWLASTDESAQQAIDSLFPAAGEIAQPEPVVVPEPEPAPVIAPEPEPEPMVAPQPELTAAPQLEPMVAPQPEPVATSQPEPATSPASMPETTVQTAAGAQASAAQQPAPAPRVQAGKPSSSMAIVSLVIGVFGIIAAVIPLFVDVASIVPGGNNPTTRLIVNNAAFGFAIVGLISALIGTHGIQAGKKKGRVSAILGVLLCVLSVVIVLMTQYLFPQVFSNAANKAVAASSSSAAVVQQSSASASASSASSGAKDNSSMALGESVKLDNGLEITVNSAQFDLENFDGSKTTMINVTYKNEGSANRSFNVYDWKALDTSGALRSETYYSGATKELQSGDLAPGGSVNGNVYFEGTASKAFYYDNIIETESNIGWVLK